MKLITDLGSYTPRVGRQLTKIYNQYNMHIYSLITFEKISSVGKYSVRSNYFLLSKTKFKDKPAIANFNIFPFKTKVIKSPL